MDRQALRNKLLDVVEYETDTRPENLNDDVSIRDGLKLDSVDLLSVMMNVESQLGIRLTSKDFEQVVTVGNLLDVIEAKLADKATTLAA